MLDVSRYLVIPFVPHGRTFKGCDCWGLVRLLYKEELGIDLPSFSTEYDKLNPEQLEEIIGKNKPEVHYDRISNGEMEEYDLLLFYQYGKVSHIGMYIGNKYFIHTNNKKNTVIEKLEAHNFDHLEGVYRVRKR